MRAPWKLDAVEGFRWTEEDAAFERLDGWLAGAFVGLLIGAAIVIVCVVFV